MTKHRQSGAIEAGYSHSSYAWYVVSVLVLTTILSYTDRQILSLIVDPLRHDLDISDIQVGLLMGTAFALVYGVAGIPFGWLADHTSRRRLIICGILLWSVGTVGCGLVHNFTQIFAARIVVGIGEAVLTPASISMISDYFPPERRGSATGVFLMGIAIGAGGAILFGGLVLRLVKSGILAGTWLAGDAAWRVVFLLLGVLGVLPALVILLIREPARHADSQAQDGGLTNPDEDSGREMPWKLGARDWLRLTPVLLAVAITSLIENGMFAWTPTLLIRNLHMPADQVGPILGAFLMVGGGAGVLAGGILGDRARVINPVSGRMLLGLISASLTAPAASFLLLGSVGSILGGITIYTFLSGVGTGAGIAALLDLVPNRRRGLLIAISFFFNVALGAGVGPVAVALAGEYLRLPGVQWALFVIAFPGFICVAALFYLGHRAAERAVGLIRLKA